MPAKQFESLVKDAIEGSAQQRSAHPPRLIRARHQARFASGVLIGHSELVVEAASSGPADFTRPLDAGDHPGSGRHVVGRSRFGQDKLVDRSAAQPDHRAGLGITTAIAAPGRSFTLGLPGNETTVLALDVPKDWVPLAPRPAPSVAAGRGSRPQYGKSRPSRGESKFIYILRNRAIRSWRRTSGFSGRHRSTCGSP